MKKLLLIVSMFSSVFIAPYGPTDVFAGIKTCVDDADCTVFGEKCMGLPGSKHCVFPKKTW